MPHTHSAAKRLRQTKKRTARNRRWKAQVKELVKKSRKLIAAKDPATLEAVRIAISTIDRAVSKGILHRNTGARKKARLMRLLHSIKAA